MSFIMFLIKRQNEVIFQLYYVYYMYFVHPLYDEKDINTGIKSFPRKNVENNRNELTST